MHGLKGPDGLVHLRSQREKYATAAYRETLCERTGGATIWSGTELEPIASATPTCLRCVASLFDEYVRW